MPEPTENELLEQAKQGDRTAFDRLQARLEAPLRRFVRRLIGQSPNEEDVVRAALLALYVNRERIEPVENLRPFLFRIVRNLCYKELRQQGRFRCLSLETTACDSTTYLALRDSRPSPCDQAQGLLLYGAVQQAMERLPELHRQTLILYAEENFSYAQIAEAMATDIGTVKSRLHNARKSLLRLLPPDLRDALGVSQREK